MTPARKADESQLVRVTSNIPRELFARYSVAADERCLSLSALIRRELENGPRPDEDERLNDRARVERLEEELTQLRALVARAMPRAVTQAKATEPSRARASARVSARANGRR